MSHRGTLYSEETTEDEDGENLYLLQNLMSLLKKAKQRRKARQPSDDYVETDEGSEDYRERFEREQQYIHDEQKHIQKVHKELCDINQKLQEEHKRLKEWEYKLMKRDSLLKRKEKELSNCADSMKTALQNELKEQGSRFEVESDERLKELSNENKKIRNTIKVLTKSNENMRKRAEEGELKIQKYEEKTQNLQNRISNLQRKVEILQDQNKKQTSQTKYSSNNSDRKISIPSKEETTPVFYEVFGSTLQWISETYLTTNIVNLIKHKPQSEHDPSLEVTNEKCLKVLVLLPRILPKIGQLQTDVQLGYLQFIYWSILHAGLSQSSQKYCHSATYRRIGEELYQPSLAQKDKETSPSFYRNKNVHVRLLSKLILLYTITQADVLSQVFQTLNQDLRLENGKDFFMKYKGTFVIFPLFKLTNKVNLMNSLDILMILSTDSPYLQPFLENLSTMEWVHSILTIMRSSMDDENMLEKLSLLLQRLSRIRSNKSIFEALQMKNAMSEIARTTNPTNDFLQLNLRSILFNLDSMKVAY